MSSANPILTRVLALAVITVVSVAAVAAEKKGQRKYLLERVDDVAIVQLYVNGFDKLPLRDRALIYHLSHAAIAGRDIFIDQKYKHSLLLRDLLEEIITNAEGIDATTLGEIERYTKLFWVNNGPHNPITSQKNVLRCTPEAFTRAATVAEKNGAKLPKRNDETTAALVGRLQDVLFNPEFDARVTNSSPGAGKDILTASANNLYENVTTKDLESFDELFPLNSKLIKKSDGSLQELIYRAGFDDRIPPGLYAKQIQQIIDHLEAAIPYASPQMARALGALIHYYRTGNALDFREYNIAWVKDKDSPVDTINGFIEVYLDARGQKGAWEGIVYFNDPEKMEMIAKFSEQAQWFEDHMPYAPRFRKPEVRGISAKAIQVVMETGDSGPTTPIGINLPNDGDIREKYGSKSVSLSNVLEAYEKSSSSASRSEFCFNDDEYQRAAKWKRVALDLEVNMHEVIGHASGRMAPGLDVDPTTVIKEYYSPLEEGRADLVALWFIGDKKLVELGLVEAGDLKEIQRAAYEEYTRNAMVQLRRVRKGDKLEEAHMRNRQMIVHWLMDKTKAIKIIKKDGRTYYRVVDVDEWHSGVGALLAEVQRIKSEADAPAAKRLFDGYGTKIDTKVRDEVLKRFAKLNRPSYTGFVMPKLTAKRNADGKLIDVRISYPGNLRRQMLEWSGRIK